MNKKYINQHLKGIKMNSVNYNPAPLAFKGYLSGPTQPTTKRQITRRHMISINNIIKGNTNSPKEITQPKSEGNLLTVIKRFCKDINSDTFDYAIANSLDKDAKEKFVKTAQRRMNAKSLLFGLAALCELPWMATSYFEAKLAAIGCAILLTGLMCKNAVYDRIKLMKNPLYKEYKASLPESTGLLKKATKLLRK